MDKFRNSGNTTEAGHVDLTFLREHTRNNTKLILEMIQIYLNETPKLLRSMSESLAQKDWNRLETAAHSLKPSFGIMGMDPELTKMARDVQDLASEKKWDARLPVLVQKITDACHEAFEELRHETEILKNES